MIKDLAKLVITIFLFFILIMIILFSIFTGYGKDFKNREIDYFIKKCLLDW